LFKLNATVDDLYQWANKLAQKYWGVDYDAIIELKNRIWKNINGRFLASRNVPGADKIPSIIQMCTKRNSERTTVEVRLTLLHELVHWRLYTTGIPHRDTNNQFIAECFRVGASISKATRAQRAFEAYQAKARG
jgi:hypothetical protein